MKIFLMFGACVGIMTSAYFLNQEYAFLESSCAKEQRQLAGTKKALAESIRVIQVQNKRLKCYAHCRYSCHRCKTVK